MKKMLPNIVLVYKLLKKGKKNANIFLDKYKQLERIILHNHKLTYTLVLKSETKKASSTRACGYFFV